LKILLADDDRDLVEMISFVLQRDGYKVVTAFDGAAALKAFEAEAPDLVVLDLNMPKRSGLDVLRAIRASSLTPVVMLSVVADDSLGSVIYRDLTDAGVDLSRHGHGRVVVLLQVGFADGEQRVDDRRGDLRRRLGRGPPAANR